MAKERNLDKAETVSVDEKSKEQVALDSTANINKAAEEGQVVQATPTYTPINTTASINSPTMTTPLGNRVSESEIKSELEAAAKALKAKNKKAVSIPKQLASTLGDTLPACINGVCINVPVDGEEYEIPEPYVELIRNSLKTVNSGDVRRTLSANQGADDNYLLSVDKK